MLRVPCPHRRVPRSGQAQPAQKTGITPCKQAPATSATTVGTQQHPRTSSQQGRPTTNCRHAPPRIAQRGTQTPRVECYLVFTRDVMTSTTGLFLKDEAFIFSVGPVLDTATFPRSPVSNADTPCLSLSDVLQKQLPRQLDGSTDGRCRSIELPPSTLSE